MTYSDVRLAVSQKGFDILREYVNKNVDKDSKDFNVFEHCDLKIVQNNICYLGWNGINWNEYNNKYVNAIMNSLYELKVNDCSYRLSRIGEDFDDIEEIYYDSNDENLKFPTIVREFDDEEYINYIKTRSIETPKIDIDVKELL